jgi:XTP/dITP diphosphohydrolase
MQLLFATSNPHKIAEVAAILAPHGVEVIGLDALEDPPAEPVEDGRTLQDNARIKAIHYARATGRPCLADDSGLEVDALHGAPGVISARYAGAGKTRAERTAANNARLLRELEAIPPDERAARFVCAMCLADGEGKIIAESRGTLDGVIADEPRGTSGFGYDPLVYLPELGRTVAELTADEKNARSHRGEAARRMAARIADLQLI